MYEYGNPHPLASHKLYSGELFGRVIRCGKLEEGDARRYLAEIISGVEYLHGQVHMHMHMHMCMCMFHAPLCGRSALYPRFSP